MSASPEKDFDLELHFLPAWAQQPPAPNRFSKFTGDEGAPRERDRSDRAPARRRPPRGDAPRRRPEGGPNRGPQRSGPRDFRDSRDRGARSDRRSAPAPIPLPEVALTFTPEEKGVESLARQIKMTGRAYPLFEIAQMILQKPERHHVTFSTVKNKEGKVLQPLFHCALDESLWLSEEEAIKHVLDHHFATFYQPEKTPTDPPKGTYTFVAQCGMSGVILGPPNYHDYQFQLRRLHAEKFPNMPFESFKARVKIVKDEAVVKKWIEDQSFKTEFICLNVPEPLKLHSREDVDKHFREVHLPNLIKSVESHSMAGSAAASARCIALQRLFRRNLEDQRRFPLKVVTALSHQFAARGLQFFKVNKTVIHVAVARPHFLDVAATPVSEGVKKIVDFLNAHPKCTRRQLLEGLAPGAVSAETQHLQNDASTPPAVAAIISDLHWLIHQGHVLEFANGMMETAKKPNPKPPAPAKPSTPKEKSNKEDTTPASTPAAATSATPGEPAAVEAKAEIPAETSSTGVEVEVIQPSDIAAEQPPEENSTGGA